MGCFCSSIFFLCWQQLAGVASDAAGDAFGVSVLEAPAFAFCCICFNSFRILISSSVNFLPWRSVITSWPICHSPSLAVLPSFIGTYTSMYIVWVQLHFRSHLQFFFVQSHCFGQSQCRFWSPDGLPGSLVIETGRSEACVHLLTRCPFLQASQANVRPPMRYVGCFDSFFVFDFSIRPFCTLWPAGCGLEEAGDVSGDILELSA